ncbi:MAG: class I SAM-dependent methyltransferase [Phycisphaerales bacterium]|nr:class I SAM-dependent methyltransferase [Phycisphaerales bacterium]
MNEQKRWQRERPALSRWLRDAGEGAWRVLDLGCGTGFHARHLAQHCGASVVGADPAPSMLDAARVKPAGDLVRWECASAEAPPAGPFDLILLLGNTLSLIEKPSEVFQAAARIAVPGGMFVVQTLDYGALRAKGEQVVRKADQRVSVVKTLTPVDDEPGIGAVLSLTVTDAESGAINNMIERLRDHATGDLITAAQEAGWRMTEQFASYEDPAHGSDRIFVFTMTRSPAGCGQT